MKSRKFVGCAGRDEAKLPNVEGSRRGMHRHPLVWLLASAMAVLGTADGLSAERPKSASQPKKAADAEHRKEAEHPKKTAKAEHHKEASHRKKATEAEHHKEADHKGVEQHKHVIEQPVTGDAAAAPLSPDLAAAKQANELVRQGKARDATALAASIGDPV